MVDSTDIDKLFTWFTDHGIRDRQNHRNTYFASLKDLTSEDLRRGCQMMLKADFKVVLWPQDFRRLCDGSWTPASKAKREAELGNMRQAMRRGEA